VRLTADNKTFYNGGVKFRPKYDFERPSKTISALLYKVHAFYMALIKVSVKVFVTL